MQQKLKRNITMAKKKATFLLFDNYDSEDYEMDECLLEDALDEIKECAGSGKWIAGGMIGRWNGCRKGYAMFDNFDKMFNAITKDCNYVKIEMENGKLMITATHHDGTNCLTCKLVTDKGYVVYDNWNYGHHSSLNGLGEYEVLEKIFSNNLFSRNVPLVA